MSNKRGHISLKTKLAAALLTMRRPNEQGELEPIIDHESAKRMTVDQILSIFHWDHYPIRKEQGGPDEHWNLEPKPILEHRHKTAKKDQPEIAKSKRLAPAHEEFRQRLLTRGSRGDAEGAGEPAVISRQARPKIKSRGFSGHRKMDGTPVWKDRKP